MTDPGLNHQTLRPERLPEQFGRYRILELLGQGGMGAVYRAWDTVLEREVALKVPTGQYAGNQEALERFQREARAAAALDHRFICKVFDVGEVSGLPYFTLQFIRGESLADLLRGKGRIVPQRALELCMAVAEALAHAHEHGIVHRDLKPSNIMLDWAGNPHLMDFGLSRRITEDSSLTVPGQLLGTPAYMAPEQVLGQSQAVGPATDLFALGIILYEMLTGVRPFPSQGQGVLVEILQLTPPPPSSLRSGLDPRLDEICRRALEKRIADRYVSAEEFATALRKALQVPQNVAPPVKYVKLAGAAIAATIVLAVTISGWIYSDSADVLRHSESDLSSTSDTPAQQSVVPPQQSAASSIESTPLAELAANTPSPPSVMTAENHRASDSQNSEIAELGQSAPEELAARAFNLFKQYCHRCHGIDFAAPGLDILDHAGLVAVRDGDNQQYVVPGSPEKSLIWERTGILGDMPPERSPQPGSAERQLLQAWIAAGAPAPRNDQRTVISRNDELTAIRNHLQQLTSHDRPYQRYFTFTRLHNDQRISTDDLKQARAALAKSLASLSWQPNIVVPTLIEPFGAIATIDLRDLGWDAEQHWNGITRNYPYGLTFNYSDDLHLRELGKDISRLSATELPYIRADWFISTATRPPLYEQLLGLPERDSELETRLRVSTADDFRTGRLIRVGFASSGVSGQNRLVDRHNSAFGGYWKSYDFISNDGRGNLFKFPLGPVLSDHPFPDLAFEHDGGEIIFSLPNGLQGYYLSDSRGRWIEAGPVEVVSDSLKTSGTPAIVNGLSCMACHKDGIIDLEDHLRTGAAVFAKAKQKLEELCSDKERLQNLVQQDRAQYLNALRQVVSPFLDLPDTTHAQLRSLPEPVSAVARRYQRDLDLQDVVLELNPADAELLRSKLELGPQFRRLGLAPLLNGGRIKRAAWSSLDTLTSLFQSTAREAQIGTPYIGN